MIARIDTTTEARMQAGLSYPVTYRLSVPSTTSVQVEVRYGDSGTWNTLPTLPEGANGIDGARADHDASVIFASVSFNQLSYNPTIFIRVKNISSGSVIPITAITKCRYYDDRTIPVVISWDDWTENLHEFFVDCCEAMQARGIWGTIGLNANHRSQGQIQPSTWPEIQAVLDNGLIEISNHSYEHFDARTISWTTQLAAIEVGANAVAITDNLTLPPQSRVDSDQFVLGFIDPHGRTHTLLRQQLAPYGHLCQRRTEEEDYSDFAPWVPALQCYDRSFTTVRLDDRMVNGGESAMSRFDDAYNAGTIFHAYGHPWLQRDVNYSWTDGSYDWGDPNDPIFTFLDYIAGRHDCWYVGWGHLYAYRRAHDTATTTLVSSVDDPVGIVLRPEPDSLVLYPEGYLDDIGEPPTEPEAPSAAPTVTLTPASQTALSLSLSEVDAATGYRYRVGTSGSWTDLGSGRTAQITSLTPGTSYTVQARAYNVAGDGPIGSATASTLEPEVNAPPVFQTSPPTSVRAGQVYVYNGVVTDADGDPITITLEEGPDWLELTDHGDGTFTLEGTAPNE